MITYQIVFVFIKFIRSSNIIECYNLILKEMSKIIGSFPWNSQSNRQLDFDIVGYLYSDISTFNSTNLKKKKHNIQAWVRNGYLSH